MEEIQWNTSIFAFFAYSICPMSRLSEKPITVLPTLHRAVDSGASSHVTGMLDDDRNSKKKEEGLVAETP